MVTIVMSFIYMYYQPSINQKSVETDNDGKYVGVEGYDGDYGVYVENSSLPVPALSSSLSFYVYYGKHGNPKQVKFSITFFCMATYVYYGKNRNPNQLTFSEEKFSITYG